MYCAVTHTENGKNYAYIFRVSEHDNIKAKIEDPHIVHANIYPTKKQAREIVEFWNACYKENGTFLFDDPAF